MPFESYAIVELMGHNRIAGKVVEEVVAGQAMLRVDVPKTTKHEPFSKYFSAGAVYAITPTDQEIAERAAEYFDESGIPYYVLRMPESPQLAEKIVLAEDRSDGYGDIGRDFDDRYDEDDEEF